ncbi:MAG: isochorismatase family protein [Phycisphaerae bacterium]|nr:isochorismatase family protein [Phycisphaerae bacterium]
MAAKRTIFWDVDTQYDFLMPDGRLYVPGAEEVIETISGVRRFALEEGFSMVASVDWHTMADSEVSEEPDYRTTFPAHCMAGSPGAQRVGYLGERPMRYVPVEMITVRELAGYFAEEPFHVVIRTNSVDVFDNPNTLAVLEIVRPEDVVVFGVALDVCVRNTVVGLLKWGKCRIHVVKNAVRGLNLIPDAQMFEQFAEHRVHLVYSDELAEICGC